jgi:hypothetical protein
VVVDGPTDPAAIEAMIAGTRKMYKERGGAVFTGKVVKIEKIKARMFNLPRSFPMKRVTVRVGKYWLGVQSPEVVIFTGIGHGDCGVPYVKGERYLFTASNIEGRLQTNMCSDYNLSASISGWYDKVFGEAREFASKQ